MSEPLGPVLATGVGSWPGVDDRAFAEATRAVLSELGDAGQLAYVPELPGRGAIAALSGRGLAVLDELGVDLQPAGWRLTGGDQATSSVEHRRARSLLAQDHDVFEELSSGYAGWVKAQVAGPWTLAATTEKPRGDKVLSDVGARRELAQALASGVANLVADLRRRVPDAQGLIIQLDEPALPAVLAGGVPTASGFGRHRTVHPPEVSEHLGWVTQAIADAGATAWAHSCARDVPVALLAGAGVEGLLLDARFLHKQVLEESASALEAGVRIGLGLVPGDTVPESEKQTTEQAQHWCDRLGADPTIGPVAITPSCGHAGASARAARTATQLCVRVADHLEGRER